MGVYESFALRKKKLQDAGKPVVYKYDVLPRPFRAQVVHIFKNYIGLDRRYSRNVRIQSRWRSIYDTYCEELGIFDPNVTASDKCIQIIMDGPNIYYVLSMIEIGLRYIEDAFRTNDVVNEINRRFREHSLGYQYHEGLIIEMTSEYIHTEVVEPAITLLHDAGFEGPLEEFMEAHKHYRLGNTEDSMVNSLKAFESTMKSICDKRSWAYGSSYTASKLIAVIFQNKLISTEMQSHFNALRTTLESGVPTVRNKKGGHGQGMTPVEIPDYLAAYTLHLTAANIVLLMKAYNSP